MDNTTNKTNCSHNFKSERAAKMAYTRQEKVFEAARNSAGGGAHGDLPSGLDVDKLRSLDQAEVRRIIGDQNTSKKLLLALARHRFGASTGSLNRFNRTDLVEHLISLLRDEKSHDAIARLASTDPTKT